MGTKLVHMWKVCRICSFRSAVNIVKICLILAVEKIVRVPNVSVCVSWKVLQACMIFDVKVSE